MNAATKPKARSPKGFFAFLSLPSAHAVRRWCAQYKTLTRASQRGHGGLSLEPGGFKKSRQRDATGWLREAYRKRDYCFSTVRLRFAQKFTRKHIKYKGKL